MSKYHQICSLYMQFPFIIDILNIHFDPQENQTRWCLHYWLLMIKSTQPPFVYRLSPHLALLFAIWTFRRMITFIMKWVLLHQPRPLNSNSLVLLRKGLHLKDCLVVSSNQVLRFLGGRYASNDFTLPLNSLTIIQFEICNFGPSERFEVLVRKDWMNYVSQPSAGSQRPTLVGKGRCVALFLRARATRVADVHKTNTVILIVKGQSSGIVLSRLMRLFVVNPKRSWSEAWFHLFAFPIDIKGLIRQ